MKIVGAILHYKMGGRKLKFTQVYNFCHHLPQPQRTKTEFKNSFTIVTNKLLVVVAMRQNKESIDLTIKQEKIRNEVIKGNLNFTFALNLITGLN